MVRIPVYLQDRLHALLTERAREDAFQQFLAYAGQRAKLAVEPPPARLAA